MSRHEPEPLSIDAAVVADFLRRHGQHQSALLVADLGRSSQARNKELMRLQARVMDLEAKYEPAQPSSRPRDYTPPPEATD